MTAATSSRRPDVAESGAAMDRQGRRKVPRGTYGLVVTIESSRGVIKPGQVREYEESAKKLVAAAAKVGR